MSLILSQNQLFTITKHVQTRHKKQFCFIRTDRQMAVTETEVRNYCSWSQRLSPVEAELEHRSLSDQIYTDCWAILPFEPNALGNGRKSEMHLASLPFVR